MRQFMKSISTLSATVLVDIIIQIIDKFPHLESPAVLDVVEANVERVGGCQKGHQGSLLKLVHHDRGV